jgi:hypothetical protein
MSFSLRLAYSSFSKLSCAFPSITVKLSSSVRNKADFIIPGLLVLCNQKKKGNHLMPVYQLV